MQRNRALSREIGNTNQPSFIPTDVLRAHKGIAQTIKFKARNQNAHDIDSVINTMSNTLYNLIGNNRNNTTQKVSVGITEHFSKPREVLNDKELVDPVTGIIHKKGTISIPADEKVYDEKYNHSNVFTLYPRSSIRKLLDDSTASLIQNREDNMARSEGASNHKLEIIDNIFVKFHVINPPSARIFVPAPKKVANSGAIHPQNKHDNDFFICCRNICF